MKALVIGECVSCAVEAADGKKWQSSGDNGEDNKEASGGGGGENN